MLLIGRGVFVFKIDANFLLRIPSPGLLFGLAPWHYGQRDLFLLWWLLLLLLLSIQQLYTNNNTIDFIDLFVFGEDATTKVRKSMGCV